MLESYYLTFLSHARSHLDTNSVSYRIDKTISFLFEASDLFQYEWIAQPVCNGNVGQTYVVDTDRQMNLEPYEHTKPGRDFRLLALKKIVIVLLSGFICLNPNLAESNKNNMSNKYMYQLNGTIPKVLMGWSVISEDQRYDENSIFNYIDGAAEVYRAYDMSSCVSRRYVSSTDPTIILDLFDMKSSENAFGIFTHDQDGEPLYIGQGALYRSGWMRFWKDRFFVSIYMEEESIKAEKAVFYLADRVASAIPKTGIKPDVINLLPKDGLEQKSIRYFYHPAILNYHYYISDKNLLNLTRGTPAVMADYIKHLSQALLLIVNYPEREMALKAYQNIKTNYLPDADSYGSVELENGQYSAFTIFNTQIIMVLESNDRSYALSLISHFKQNR